MILPVDARLMTLETEVQHLTAQNAEYLAEIVRLREENAINNDDGINLRIWIAETERLRAVVKQVREALSTLDDEGNG